MRLIFVFSIAATLVAHVAPSTARAQNMGWSTITPSIAGTDTLGLALRGDFGTSGTPSDGSARSGPTRSGATGQPAAAVDPAAFDYQPSLSRRRANIDKFIRTTRQRNAAAGEDLARVFHNRDILQEFQPELDTYGLQISNLGDAFTIYWIVAWQTSRGNNDDFTPATVRAVKAQALRALASVPAVAHSGDAARQEFAETLWIHALLMDAAIGSAKGDNKLLAMLAETARNGAAGMGLDLGAMRLTEKGFVPG